MLKLYYSPGACSLSPHIVLHESTLPFEAIAAPTKTHQLADGTDYYTINPLGYVPLLVLDDGSQLREGPVIVQWLADHASSAQLAPAHGSLERYRMMEWLNFIGTELHKGGFSPLFNASIAAEAKGWFRERLLARLAFVEEHLKEKDYLLGANFSVADAYLFTVSNWTIPMKIDLAQMPNLIAFRKRMQERPAVQAAMRAEGLIT